MRARGLLLVHAALLLGSCGDRLVLFAYGRHYTQPQRYGGIGRGIGDRHRGVDFGPRPLGDEVLASAPGVVTSVRRSKVSGNAISIAHYGAMSTTTFYVHLDRTYVRPGRIVIRGEPIGTVGLFPRSNGVVHVHLELWCDRERDDDACPWSGPLEGTRDPMPFIVGCFDEARRYPGDRFVLTYPFRC
jgi:murein DD-endopeptidase MepM/ murein hydrolase activator NlpD